jgi:glycosyltransferase involved in cell wall biosynthesis
VADDGSTDGTQNFVRELSAIDSRVRLLPPRPSSGYAMMFANWNYAIAQSRGEAFCMLGDDDRLLPEFVESMVRPLAENPAVVASFCNHWVIDASGSRLRDATETHSRHYGRADLPAGVVADPLAVALRQTMAVVAAMYRASIFRGEAFDLSCGGAADIDYGIRAARIGPLYYVDDRLVEYRAHANTTTSTRTAFMIDGTIRAYSKHTFPGPAHEAMRRARLRRAFLTKAVFICTKDRREWWESVRMYRRHGGSLAQPAILLSAGLALLPKGAGEFVRGGLKRTRALSAPRQTTPGKPSR